MVVKISNDNDTTANSAAATTTTTIVIECITKYKYKNKYPIGKNADNVSKVFKGAI